MIRASSSNAFFFMLDHLLQYYTLIVALSDYFSRTVYYLDSAWTESGLIDLVVFFYDFERPAFLADFDRFDFDLFTVSFFTAFIDFLYMGGS
jgi:hypothetical protein